ncbi:hypothetical protein STRATTON_264 [Erwinia phage vB_EamM_Stratton]|uniref:Uncharacterized protein n=2 Tax=Erskinevirus EaH2 TaxID=2169883 RepID=A0A1B2IHF5_9CAUD|nr:hypothetical protein G173_gp162 [Erwinia phage phiEaH2]AFQ96707.1 hypothetical protein [Erwinia phage phiEaH2]ANZ50689.1 hypothetical protein STRATTON_264 [Erwinia phage vB_EamM_Stratton]
MSILDSIKMRNGIPTGKNITQQETEGYSPQQRLNFVTLGNAVELTTEILHGLMKGNSGLTDRQGDQRMLKRDIADLVGARITARIQEAVSTENGGQA